MLVAFFVKFDSDYKAIDGLDEFMRDLKLEIVVAHSHLYASTMKRFQLFGVNTGHAVTSPI